MKRLLFLLAFAAVTAVLPAQPTRNATYGSTYTVWSSHTTASDGIQAWASQSLVSPSGRWFTEETHGDSGRPDGYTGYDVTLDEPGVWQAWLTQGQDAPQSGTTWQQLFEYVQVSAPILNRPPSATISGSANLQVGQTGTWSFSASDPDGDLAAWRFYASTNPGPQWSSASGGSAGPGTYSASFPTPGTYTWVVEARDASGATASDSITVTVTTPPPPNNPPTVSIGGSTNLLVGESGSWAFSASDADGNLEAWRFYASTNPAALWSSASGGSAGPGSHATTFASPGTYVWIVEARDVNGLTASDSLTVTVAASGPAQYTLVTTAGSGGGVSPGGVFLEGTVVTVTAAPDTTHDFAGWTGDAGGSANPLSVSMDRNRTVRATFTLKSFTLTTSAASGGAVTPGGAYPIGSTVAITASPDAAHYFTGWSGDATGGVPSIAILLDRPKSVQAQFAAKATQTISFQAPGNQSVGAALPLVASSTSGLPVSFVVSSGPATLNGGTLSVTGPGAITVQAVQAGDAWTLPAAPVTATFNATAPVVLRYQSVARTLLQDGKSPAAANYVIGNP